MLDGIISTDRPNNQLKGQQAHLNQGWGAILADDNLPNSYPTLTIIDLRLATEMALSGRQFA
jgi:hypothetical protein